jgi:hypothetical protein
MTNHQEKIVVTENITIDTTADAHRVYIDGKQLSFPVIDATIESTRSDEYPRVVLIVPAKSVDIKHNIFKQRGE